MQQGILFAVFTCIGTFCKNSKMMFLLCLLASLALPSVSQTMMDNEDKKTADMDSGKCHQVKKLMGVSYGQLKDDDDEPQLDKITLEYRDVGVRKTYNINEAARRIPREETFNPNLNLYIIIHGYMDDPQEDLYQELLESLFKREYCNVLALDASKLVDRAYLRSTTYVRFIGERLGEVLAAMVKRGVAPLSIHIIGVSLGAHMCGFTGKSFTRITGSKVGRITGLDPAGVCFGEVDPDVRLNSTDADFVDVILADDTLGISDPIGQVSYYPNGGSNQPNCDDPSCNHGRAFLYFLESVERPYAFPALKCKDWKSFKRNRCEGYVSPMGIASKPGTAGLYFLRTAGSSPYGLGEEGLKWKNEGTVRIGLLPWVFSLLKL